MPSSTCFGQEGLTYDVGRSRPTLCRYFGRSGHNHDIAINRVTYPRQATYKHPCRNGLRRRFRITLLRQRGMDTFFPRHLSDTWYTATSSGNMHSSTRVGQEGRIYEVGRSRPALRRYSGRSGQNHDIARVTYPRQSSTQTPVYERMTPKV